MGFLIDTSVLVAAERGKFELNRFLDDRAGAEVCISVLTWSELLHGLYRCPFPELRHRRSRFIENIEQSIDRVAFDLRAADVHARIWAELSAAGKMIGAHDAIIAATAIANDLEVATLNLSEFARVSGISVLDISQYLIRVP